MMEVGTNLRKRVFTPESAPKQHVVHVVLSEQDAAFASQRRFLPQDSPRLGLTWHRCPRVSFPVAEHAEVLVAPLCGASSGRAAETTKHLPVL